MNELLLLLVLLLLLLLLILLLLLLFIYCGTILAQHIINIIVVVVIIIIFRLHVISPTILMTKLQSVILSNCESKKSCSGGFPSSNHLRVGSNPYSPRYKANNVIGSRTKW